MPALPGLEFSQIARGTPAVTRIRHISDSQGQSLALSFSGRGSARAEDAQETPTQSDISPSILQYTEIKVLQLCKLFPLHPEAVRVVRPVWGLEWSAHETKKSAHETKTIPKAKPKISANDTKNHSMFCP